MRRGAASSESNARSIFHPLQQEQRPGFAIAALPIATRDFTLTSLSDVV
jgi:hypothetical protein